MLTEPNIDKKIIQSKIEENYGIKVVNLTHVTGGEASWGYRVETQSGQTYFFKIHAGLLEYEKRFDLTYKLFNDCGIKNITHPIKTLKGDLVVYLDKYPAALFNFIAGYNASEKELTEKQRFALGELLGKIHKASNTIGDYTLKEDFIYGNTSRLLGSIKESKTLINDDSNYKRKVAELLLENKEKILKRLQELEELGQKLRNQNLDFVICHGEPHRWNTMVNEQGEVFLIDWDDSLFAPKEKDLTMIKYDSAKFDGYKSIVGEFSLNQEVIHYYDLEWNISEIDAWSYSILHENLSGVQNQHNLEFLISDLEKLDN